MKMGIFFVIFFLWVSQGHGDETNSCTETKSFQLSSVDELHGIWEEEDTSTSHSELRKYIVEHLIPRAIESGKGHIKIEITVNDNLKQMVATEPPSTRSTASVPEVTSQHKEYCFKLLRRKSDTDLWWLRIWKGLVESWKDFDGFVNVTNERKRSGKFKIGNLTETYRYFTFGVLIDKEHHATVQDLLRHYNLTYNRVDSDKYGRPVPCEWKIWNETTASEAVFYKVFDDQVTLEKAIEECESYTGRLATFDVKEIGASERNPSSCYWSHGAQDAGGIASLCTSNTNGYICESGYLTVET